MAKAKGLLASGYPANELLARCPRELLGAKAPRYLKATMRPQLTAPVLPAGGLPSGTPRTRDRLCRCTGPKATTHGVIARAHTGSIARVFENSKAGALWPQNGSSCARRARLPSTRPGFLGRDAGEPARPRGFWRARQQNAWGSATLALIFATLCLPAHSSSASTLRRVRGRGAGLRQDGALGAHVALAGAPPGCYTFGNTSWGLARAAGGTDGTGNERRV